ncbi:hypothetical protein KEM52_003473 [Ascosphaera acerosa]|nr:hypothetical protein KEM52_003473 [Ascosphaera acerosa]
MGSPSAQHLPRLRRKTSEQLLRDETLTPAEREDIIRPHLPEPPRSRNGGAAARDRSADGVRAEGRGAGRTGRVKKTHGATKQATGAGAGPGVTTVPPPLSRRLLALLQSYLYFLTYFFISLAVGFWIRGRHAYHALLERVYAVLYHHHRTPELIQRDVRKLSRLPQHLSCILRVKDRGRVHQGTGAALAGAEPEAGSESEVDAELDDESSGDGSFPESLADDVAELVAWSACAGIPMLSIYERTGSLKPHLPTLHRVIVRKLAAYYGFLAHQPTVYLYAPHHALYSPRLIDPALRKNTAQITVLLLSASDGRETLVDLTRTLAEMAQHGRISPQDVSMELVDAELAEIVMAPTPAAADPERSTSAPGEHCEAGAGQQGRPSESTASGVRPPPPFIQPEPDLLVCFGPYLALDGYPPWAIRLTEMYCTGTKGDLITGGGGETVEYQKFLKGLWRYAKAEMRFGR